MPTFRVTRSADVQTLTIVEAIEASKDPTTTIRVTVEKIAEDFKTRRVNEIKNRR